MLASSVVGRGWGALFSPLDYGQTAPAGFLLLQKAAVSLLGPGEHALRLVPLLAGLAALFAFPAVARRYVSRGAAVLATALFALAPYLVYYSSEAKPYALDVLVALAVLAAAADFSRPGVPGRREMILLLAAGALGVWLSQPAVFLLAGCGSALLVPALRARDGARIRTLLGIGMAWGMSFAASYALSRGALADAEYMRAFWRSGFLPLAPAGGWEWSWLPRMLVRLFREPLGVYGEDASLATRLQTGVGLALCLLGCVALARRGRLRLALLVAPLPFALAASALRLYPFGGDYPTAGRVVLFLLPALVLLVAAGAAWLWERGGPAARTAAGAAAAAMLLPSLQYAAVGVPHVRAELKPLLEHAAGERRPGDVLYVYYRAWPSFAYYAERYGWTGGAAVRGACARARPARYLADLERLRGPGRRAWFLFVDGTSDGGFDERRLMTAYLDHVGTKLEGQVSHGAWLYLYELRPEAERPQPFPARIPLFRGDAALECRGPWAG